MPIYRLIFFLQPRRPQPPRCCSLPWITMYGIVKSNAHLQVRNGDERMTSQVSIVK